MPNTTVVARMHSKWQLLDRERRQWVRSFANRQIHLRDLCHVGFRKALDIDGGAKSCAPLITYEKHGRANQQWQIDSGDSTIVNPSSNLVVDVDRAVMYAGQGLIAYHKHGKVNQQFSVQLH
jgi:hypothetical protein